MELVQPSPTAEHFVWAMFTTLDGRYVAGPEQITARSPNLDLEAAINKRRRHEKLGLSADRLPDRRAYAFLPLDDEVFVFCHYQLSGLEEPPPSRGQHIFVHYIWTTADQLAQLHWNLLPVFDLFSEIRPEPQLATMAPLVLPISSSQSDRRGLSLVRQKSELTQAVIVRMLAGVTSAAPIILGPGTARLEDRLAWLCGLALCLPPEIRRTLYFSTSADPLATKAGLFFTVRDDPRAIDWNAPAPLVDGPGAQYANWVVGLAREEPAGFLATMASLRNCRAADAAVAERSDLAALFMSWKATRRESPSDATGLDQLGKEIDNFWTCLSDEERIGYFQSMLLEAIRLEYRQAVEVLLQKHEAFLNLPDNRQRIAKQLSDHLVQRTSSVPSVARFLMDWVRSPDARAVAYKGELVEAVLQLLSAQAGDTGVGFWRALVQAGWQPRTSASIPRILKSLSNISSVTLRNLLAIVARFRDPSNVLSLAAVLKTSATLAKQGYPKTIALVDVLADAPVIGTAPGLELVAESYGETREPDWLALTTDLLLKHYPVDSFSSPAFLVQLRHVTTQGSSGTAVGSLFDTLGCYLAALNATREEDLRSLMVLASEGNSALALDCLLSLLQKKQLTQPVSQSDFDLVLRVNRQALTRRLPRNDTARAADTFAAPQQWLEFLAQLAQGNDALPEERRTLQAYYAVAYEAVRAREQVQRAQDLCRVLEGTINPPFAERHDGLFWQLTNQVLYCFNHRALAIIARAFAQSDVLRQYYRQMVSESCTRLIPATGGVGQWLGFNMRLRQEGLVWESATVYFELVQGSTEEEIVAQFPGQIVAVVDRLPGDISLEELGRWVHETRPQHRRLLDMMSREVARSPALGQQLRSKINELTAARGDKVHGRRLLSREGKPDYNHEAHEFLSHLGRTLERRS